MADEIVVASAVDELPSDYVHIYIDLQFDDIQKEVLAKPNLSSSDRAWFEREANNLQAKYKEILGGEDSPLKDAALRAVAPALCLSFHYVGGPQAIREFRLDQTARARERKKLSGRELQTIVHDDLVERKVHVLNAWDKRLQDIVAGREATSVTRLRHVG